MVGRIESERVQRSAVARVEPVQIDPEKAATFMAEIRDIRLSGDINAAIDGYDRVGERNRFLWNWVRRGVEITSLSIIDPALWDHVCDTKTLGVMVDVLLDDIADVGSDEEFLEQLIAITEGRYESLARSSTDKRAYYDYTCHVWRQIDERLRSYPRYSEFRDILAYDYRQLMNSMRYSMLIRKCPAIMNVPEHNAYLPHNMHMMISGTIDLMASSGFDIDELGRVRRALWFGQQMGRIGNLVTTWEREIREKDYSSGVFPKALALGVLTAKDLSVGDQIYISQRIRDAGIEDYFLRRWRRLRDDLARHARSVRTVQLAKLVEGLETLIQLHLGSRGLK